MLALLRKFGSPVRANAELDAAIAALPIEAFRLRARDAVLAMVPGWRARFAWEADRDKPWATQPDAIVLTFNGVDLLRIVDLTRRPPYPPTWTVSRRPEDPTLIRGATKALHALAGVLDAPPPSFQPTFARPDWDALD